ncbi:hypothetical protein KHU50_006306 [Colletotrichum sp. SAR 10_65]|nr:hypothetical protein KHU50_006306 [Colletotrichum sp. SAR 10_65]
MLVSQDRSPILPGILMMRMLSKRRFFRQHKQRYDTHPTFSSALFLNTIQVNISGVYFTTVGFVPLLRKCPNPSVIVIASLAAVMNQRAMGTLTYATSKAAGIFPSEMTTTNKSSASASLNHFATAAAKRCTAGRAGLPEEIVGPCLMLSSKAGGYMNGGCIMVDGGRAMGGSINDGIRMPEDTYSY